jgi:hypothetical protein
MIIYGLIVLLKTLGFLRKWKATDFEKSLETTYLMKGAYPIYKVLLELNNKKAT